MIPPRNISASKGPGPETLGFRDVKRIVLDRVQDGTWPPGSLLPAETDLARDFACARTTVNRAMQELAAEGLLERRRKAGTRVRAAPIRQARLTIPLIRNEVEATGAAYRHALIDRDRAPAPDWLRARLALPPDRPVLHLRCLHFADNAPFAFEDRWINLAAVPDADAADFAAIGPNEWLVREVPLTNAEFSFRAVAADPTAAGLLGVPTGTALFCAERVTWLKGIPVTLAAVFYPPSYRLTTRV